jgi:hypothetical protein
VQCPAFGPGIACPVPIPRFLSASTSFNSPPLINSSLAPAASPPERANNSSGLGGGSLRRNQSCSQPGVVSPCCISPSSQPPLWKTRCSTSFSPSSLPRLERLGMPAVPGLVALVSIHRKRTHAGRPPPLNVPQFGTSEKNLTSSRTCAPSRVAGRFPFPVSYANPLVISPSARLEFPVRRHARENNNNNNVGCSVHST